MTSESTRQDTELDNKAILAAFGITVMTLYNWRGGKNGRTPLPFHTRPKGSRHSCYYLLSEVKSWAKANNVKMKKIR